METLTTTPRIFLTDYGSYNDGTQFEFGHWVNLDDFSDETELNDYISEHFAQADEKRPLDEYGTTREEIMITDFEGFPRALYSECMNFEKLYLYLNLDEEEKRKTAFILEQNNGDIDEALDLYENVTMHENDGDQSKYELFEMYHPDAYKIAASNDYFSIDEDAFIRNEFTEFEFEGQDYWVSDDWSH